MRRILTLRRAKLFTNSSGIRSRRICCPHQTAPGLNSALFFQDHHHTRPTGHKLGQPIIERFAAMDFIKAFCLWAGLMNQFHRAYAKAATDDPIDDLARSEEHTSE